MNSCPYKKDVVAYRTGFLTGGKKRIFEEHLKTCATCQQEMKIQETIHTTMTKQLDPGNIESYVISRVRLIKNIQPKLSWRYVFQIGVYVAAAITLLRVCVPALTELLFAGANTVLRLNEFFPSLSPGVLAGILLSIGVLFLATSGVMTWRVIKE